MGIFGKLYNFFVIKHFWLFILLIVVISYGQILQMGAWKDDNAIFFKFDHINETAGFFGRGILGEGPYKFSVTPYYLIYKIFGNSGFVPYYSLILIFYYLSALSICLLFTKLHSAFLGKISAFLFACGYVASEGFYWLSNAMFSNLAVISLTLILVFYYLFLAKRRPYLYWLSLFIFWLSLFYFPLRTYPFIAVIAAFEIIFGIKEILLKKIPASLARLVPFSLVYYLFFLKEVDSRAGLMRDFVLSVLKGDLSQLNSFFSTLASLFIPNKYLDFIRNISFLGRYSKEMIYVNLGILILGILLILFFALKEKIKKVYLLCIVWLVFSILIFTIYNPGAFLETTHRYLVNAIFPLAGILGIVFINFYDRNNLLGKIITTLVIIWGIGNIYNSYSLLTKINRDRSVPVANFYKQLKVYLPEIKKDEAIYFDVKPEARSYFDSAFSVSSMPETTAIAWRYKIDRYDFSLFTDYSELIAFLSEKPERINGLHTFYYDKSGLTDTTEETRRLLIAPSVALGEDKLNQVSPLTSTLLTFKAKVSLDQEKIAKMYPQEIAGGKPIDLDYQNKLIAYLTARQLYYQKVKVESSSEWKYQELPNIIDNNIETSWRGHRIWWHDNKNEKLTLDLGGMENVNRLIWVNLRQSTSPISYLISASSDKIHWQKVVAKIKAPPKVDGEKVIEDFPSVSTRYLLFDITETLTDDSPAFAEVEVAGSDFRDININDAFSFIQNPLEKINDRMTAVSALQLAAPWLNIEVTVKTNKETYTLTVPVESKLDNARTYNVFLPSGGTALEKVSVDISNLPLILNVDSLKVKNLSLAEMQKYGLVQRFSQN